MLLTRTYVGKLSQHTLSVLDKNLINAVDVFVSLDKFLGGLNGNQVKYHPNKSWPKYIAILVLLVLGR